MPPDPVVPPVAFKERPLVLKLSVEPLILMLFVGAVPVVPEPDAFAVSVSKVAPVPSVSGPPEPAPTASNTMEPPKPLPADEMLKLAVVL